jgi:Arylsulfotransferase (ASST)
MRSRISWSAITSTKTRLSASTAIVLALAFATVLATARDADSAKEFHIQTAPAKKSETPKPKPEQFGVLINDLRACPGYNLINPGRKQTFLYDNDGRVVHTWSSEHTSGAAAYILDNGNLFRPSEVVNRKPGFQGPAASGRFQEFDWDGNLVWEFEYHSEKRLPHHDAIKLPNGNLLAICWERIEEKAAIAAGRAPETVKDSHLQPDCLVEIKPTGKKTGEIVWEWRSWDHLIQGRDKTKTNYGNVSQHPELFDLNYIHGEDDASKAQSKDRQKKGQTRAPRKNPDWMHVNAVAFNAELDQIVLSSPAFHEIWIIDHSTTKEEAKGHTGGRWGKGGDILYRWGNPRAYGNGTSVDQRLFGQHNIQWIAKGLSGEGHLLVFNNGGGRKPVEHSSVDEFVPPTDKDGNYIRPKSAAFGPAKPLWSYTAPEKKDFYSWFISGAQRLPNGNTLINSGAVGIVFEVTPEKETVWRFSNPFKPLTNAPLATGAPPKRFEAIASASRDALGMTPDQRRKLDEIDKDLIAKLDKILAAEQIKSFAEPNPSDATDLVKRPPGEYLAVFDRSTPKVTDEERKELRALQKDFNPKIAKIMTDAQKALIADFKKGPVAAPAGRGGRPGTGNTLFRATRYALNHPAFAGRVLKPGKTLVEIQKELDNPQPNKETNPAKLKTFDASK